MPILIFGASGLGADITLIPVKRLGTQKSETRHMGGFLLSGLSRCQLSLPISFLTEAWKAGFD